MQIRALQNELSTLIDRDTIDVRLDTDEEVNILREENQNLTKNLEDLDAQHQLAMDRLLTLKKELETNFESLKQDHEDLKNSNDEYASEIKTLLEKLGERDKDIENSKTFKNDFETLHHKYQNLERMYGLLRENAEKFQEENQELHEEIFKLQEELTKLEHDLEISTNHTEHSESVPKVKYDELMKELNDIKDRRNANLMHHDEINIDDNAKSVIEHLKRDINDLKYQLSQKESDDRDSADHKLIKSEKVMQLYNKYVNFEIPLDYVGEIPSVGDNIVLYKLESVFKTVNSFKKEIDALEHQISEKNLNINHLQTQIDDLTTENDFLTTDIQHFEQELSEMKKNNDFLLSEITALKNASKLEPIIETHEDNLAKLENDLDICNNMNKTFESEIRRIEKELAEVKAEKKNLQDSLADMRSKYTTMLDEIEMCKNKTEAVEALEVTAYNQEIEKLKQVSDELDDLKKRLNAANSKNEQLTIDIHIIENDKVLLTKQVDDLTNALEEKTSSHNDLGALNLVMDSKLQELEGQLDAINKNKEEVEADRQTLTKKVAELESQMSDARNTSSEVERLTKEKTHLEQKFNQVIKENSTLVSQIQSLQNREQDLVNQDNILRVKGKGKGDGTHSENEKTGLKDSCIVKVVEQQDLHKQENHELIQKNIHLETEISSTDAKTLHLDEKLKNLAAEIDEKDELIDSLNASVHEDKITIFNLNKTLNELNESMLVKNDELERLRLRAESLSHQLVCVRERFNQNQEELHISQSNSYEIGRELSYLREEMNFRNAEIATLIDAGNKLNGQLANVTGQREKHEATIRIKEQEIKQLKRSITELMEKQKASPMNAEEYSQLAHEKDLIEKEVTEVKSILTMTEKELETLKSKSEELEKAATEYNSTMEKAAVEKTELINLINLKHNESIQYHNEIQRLNQTLLEQSNEIKRLVEEKNEAIHNHSEVCSNCKTLRMTLKEKDDIIISLNNNITSIDCLKTETQNANKIVKNLTEKCDHLERSLATQLETVKKLTAENVQVHILIS